MSEPIRLEFDGEIYKVHPDGKVYRIYPGLFSPSTKLVGTIPYDTPQNEVEQKIRDLPGR
jgi:hypothetical protein